jgi:23S rRNA pseudouridine1911/1915/1917 synthase
MNEVVPAALDGERVDRLVAMLCSISRAAAATLIQGGAVLLDGEVVLGGKQRVRAGQTLIVTDEVTSAPAVAAPDPTVEVPVVHADESVIVVDKPAGLVVHPGAGHLTGTMVNGLLARFPDIAGVGPDPERPGIVHRLDAGTSGLLVVARNQASYDDLVAQMAGHSARRTYLALVWGVPAARAGVVDAPIGRSARTPTRMAVTADGRAARTRYEVEEAFTDPVASSLLRCNLETGRTHQIRVHLAAIGHPVVGDERYGGVRPGLDAPRPMLHATALAFRHPRTGAEVAFDSPVPADMAAVLSRLR